MSRREEKTAVKWVIGETAPIERTYALGQRLGQPGQYGYAQKATHRETGEVRAVKVIPKTRFQNSQSHLTRFRAEFEMMVSLDHPNIIKAYESFEDRINFYIVMEYCSGGELFDRIQEKKRYSERDASVVIRQIVAGLQYLHEHKIAHCDLKPDNFLFTASDSEDLKIIDFGMSKFTQARSYMKSVVGTMFYIAPEVFQQHYTFHCDMWSVGVVMFIMLFGFPPFHGSNDSVTQRRILAGFRPEVRSGYGAFFPSTIPVSQHAMDLIRRLLDSDPALRLTATECLEHPWLRDPSQNSSTPLAASVMTNLGNFQSSCRFKHVVLSALSSALDDQDVDDLKKAFVEFDVDGDGTITADELKQVLAKSMGTNNTELEQTVRSLLALDVDGDGNISYEELVMASVQKKLAAKEERLVNVFTALDQNGDGKVTAEEIEAALSGFMEDSDDIAAMIREIDTDGDGSIDYDEFVQMFMNTEAQQAGLA